MERCERSIGLRISPVKTGLRVNPEVQFTLSPVLETKDIRGDLTRLCVYHYDQVCICSELYMKSTKLRVLWGSSLYVLIVSVNYPLL